MTPTFAFLSYPAPTRFNGVLVSWSRLLSTALVGVILGNPLIAWAGDPFRSTNPAPIGEHTEAAFDAVFAEGDYPKALEDLEQALESEADEPLVYALQASIAYLQEDWDGIRTYGQQTLERGQAMAGTNPLRGNLYTAIGHLMEGAHALSPKGQGSGRGLATALGKLQQAYGALDRAKRIDATDPELNLIQGFMDLMIALYLPLANPDQAITQLETYAAPSYLADWGMAIAYRDLDRYSEAFQAIDRALEESSHPQLYYLRAQVAVRQGLAQDDRSSLIQAQTDFRRALARSSQLPKQLVGQMFREYCRNQNRIDGNDNRACNSLRDSEILSQDGNWGPDQVPQL